MPELGVSLRAAASAFGRAQVDEAPAANGPRGAGVAQHEAVERRSRERRLQHELDGAGAPGAILLEQDDAGANLGRAMMEPYRLPHRKRLALGGEQREFRVDPRLAGAWGRHDHVAMPDRRLRDAGAGKVERAAVPGPAALGGRFWAWIERTRAAMPEGETMTLSPDRDGPTAPPGHHRAGAGQREAAIHREAGSRHRRGGRRRLRPVRSAAP